MTKIERKRKAKEKRSRKENKGMRNMRPIFVTKKNGKKIFSVDIIFVPVNGATSSYGCGKVVKWEFYLLF